MERAGDRCGSGGPGWRNGAADVGMRDSDDHSELRDRGEGESDGRDRATTSAPAPVGACEEE